MAYAIKCPWCGSIAHRDPVLYYTYCNTPECKAICALAGYPAIPDELLITRRKTQI